jgi:hypothetical protein
MFDTLAIMVKLRSRQLSSRESRLKCAHFVRALPRMGIARSTSASSHDASRTPKARYSLRLQLFCTVGICRDYRLLEPPCLLKKSRVY